MAAQVHVTFMKVLKSIFRWPFVLIFVKMRSISVFVHFLFSTYVCTDVLCQRKQSLLWTDTPAERTEKKDHTLHSLANLENLALSIRLVLASPLLPAPKAQNFLNISSISEICVFERQVRDCHFYRFLSESSQTAGDYGEEIRPTSNW